MSSPKVRKARTRTPKQSRSRATVATILEGATRILAERGWAGFNTNAVAVRAGVSVGSIYEYFSDKQALADAIATAHLARGEAMLFEAVRGLGPAPAVDQLVDVLVAGLVALHEDDPRLHRVLSAEVPLSPGITARMEALRAQALHIISAALAPHVRDPVIAAQLLVDTADAVIHRWIVDETGAPASSPRMTRELGQMFRAYLAGMAKAGPAAVAPSRG